VAYARPQRVRSSERTGVEAASALRPLNGAQLENGVKRCGSACPFFNS
jgi:hypothetical protein